MMEWEFDYDNATGQVIKTHLAADPSQSSALITKKNDSRFKTPLSPLPGEIMTRI